MSEGVEHVCLYIWVGTGYLTIFDTDTVPEFQFMTILFDILLKKYRLVFL